MTDDKRVSERRKAAAAECLADVMASGALSDHADASGIVVIVADSDTNRVHAVGPFTKDGPDAFAVADRLRSQLNGPDVDVVYLYPRGAP